MESKKRTRGGSASSNGGSEERVRCVVDMYGVSVSFLDGANELVEVKTPGVSPQKFVDESDPTVRIRHHYHVLCCLMLTLALDDRR
jgi:hypothetical protein